jgi:hypothetical protein
VNPEAKCFCRICGIHSQVCGGISSHERSRMDPGLYGTAHAAAAKGMRRAAEKSSSGKSSREFQAHALRALRK